ncbi:MAG TPA: ABC transporter permease [Steroidobacteraceae bacterium]|nr:ABC transporter permease [Steroidobacteraceae bacterium]
MSNRVLMVAQRDFLATVTSRGFLLGLLVMPLLLLVLAVLIPRFARAHGPPIHGEVAVIDASGKVLAELRAALSPERLAASAAPRINAGGPPAGFGQSGPPPILTVIERTGGADPGQAKAWLIQPPKAEPPHLAFIVIHTDAVVRAPGEREFGGYDLYVSRSLDDGTEGVIHEGVRRALVTTRLRSSGIDEGTVTATMRVARPQAVVVGASGEQSARRGLSRMLPFISGLLLFIGVFTAGQLLMTSTIEEKSSRVVEVLLAAVSPLELMAGKLLAQLGVGLLILTMYVGLGVLALSQFSMLSALDPLLVFYLVLFYLLAYLVYGGLMLAIGGAVSQIADAQSMMAPVMLLIVIPYVLTQFIGNAPNAPLSVALSFIPPANSFAMLARLASGTPPPVWQVCLSVAAGLAAAAAAVWFAAKVLRIGLLMQGKPPDLATLVRWARMA